MLFSSRSMSPVSDTCQKVYHFVVLALSGVRGSGPNRWFSTRWICWKKWDLNWDLDEWSKSVVTAKYDLMYRKTIGNISSYLAFQNSHFFNAVQKSKTFQLQFTCKAEKSPFESLMREIQPVTLVISGFQQWSNVKFKRILCKCGQAETWCYRSHKQHSEKSIFYKSQL